MWKLYFSTNKVISKELLAALGIYTYDVSFNNFKKLDK